MNAALRDLRYAIRTLWHAPGYLITSVAVLALGIGANATIFSFVEPVILNPLPYPDANRLVFVWERFAKIADPLFQRGEVSRRHFLEWKRQAAVFSDMAAIHEASLNETGIDRPRRVSTAFASANLFPLLGVQARIGRLFGQAEESPGNDRVAVIGDEYFERRFQRSPTALGSSITLGGASYTVIGVLRPRFHLPSTWEGQEQIKPEVWVPLSRLWNTREDEDRRQLTVMARLEPGVAIAQARSEMEAVAERVNKVGPPDSVGWTANVFSFASEDTSPNLHRGLALLLGSVGLLLLIACANLANLTLARATRRSREIAVRIAMGASRARIAAQLLIEALVVSAAGGAVGLVLARWSVRLMLALNPPDVQRPELVTLNAPVFIFAAVTCLVTAILFGLAPALAASNTDLNRALKGSGRGSSAAQSRSRQLLIAVEVALAFILLTGAGLMIRSLREVIAAGIGFDTSHLATVDVELPERRYPDGPGRSRFFRELLVRARATTGVKDAAIVDALPLHQVQASNFFIAGRPDPEPAATPIADKAHVSPEYFPLIGLRMRAGRGFTAADLALNETDRDGVAIVNQAFARQFFPQQNPLGQRLQEPDRKRNYQIVGVVEDYTPMGVENGVRAQIFWPFLKVNAATLLARTAGPPGPVARALQNAVWSIDKELPQLRTEAMDHYVEEWQSQRKFSTLLLSVFAGLALVLALMGIYGVLSNLVASRTREIGIRMAVGATPGAIAGLVLRQSLIPVLAGLAAGLAGSLALGRFIEALLFHVRPRDPLTLALTALVILLVVPVAIGTPLWRATRVDCTVALRED